MVNKSHPDPLILVSISNSVTGFGVAFEKCQKNPVYGVYLTPCHVPVTSSFIVTDIPAATESNRRHSNLFLLFFRKKRLAFHVNQHVLPSLIFSEEKNATAKHIEMASAAIVIRTLRVNTIFLPYQELCFADTL